MIMVGRKSEKICARMVSPLYMLGLILRSVAPSGFSRMNNFISCKLTGVETEWWGILPRLLPLQEGLFLGEGEEVKRPRHAIVPHDSFQDLFLRFDVFVVPPSSGVVMEQPTSTVSSFLGSSASQVSEDHSCRLLPWVPVALHCNCGREAKGER